MRKILKFLLLAVSLTPCLLYSQSEKLRNLPYIDQRRIHFGFMLGVHTQDIEFVHNGIVSEDGSQWVAEIPGFSPGFAVGLVGDYAFTENLSLRLTPSMYFGSKYIKMVDLNTGEKENQDIKSNYLMRSEERRVGKECRIGWELCGCVDRCKQQYVSSVHDGI